MSWRRLARSFRFAFKGVQTFFISTPNAWLHVVAAAAALALGVWLGVEAAQLALLALAIGLVLVAEMLNTAIESTVDLVTVEIHPLAARAKDIAAAAVLVAAVGAVVVGLLILGPRLVRL